jgi:hypothetical protein
MSAETSRSHWHFFAALFVSSFVLNWVWELGHKPFCAEMAKQSWRQTLLLGTAASLGDVVLTFVVYGVGALTIGHLRWTMSRTWNVYAAAAVLGAAPAAAVECHALASGRWSYTELMPIVPGVGLGLWPLLQLTLLVPIALWSAHWWSGRE